LPDIDVDTLIMERILNTNRYYKKQMIYQAYKITNRDSCMCVFEKGSCVVIIIYELYM